MDVVAFRALVTAVVMFVYLGLFNRKRLHIKLRHLWCFIGTGLLSVVFFNVCYFTCMNYTSLSTAAILLYTAPAFVMVMSFLLFKEKFTGMKVVALILAFVGCVCVSGGFTGMKLSQMGLLTGLGAGFGYALYSIFGKFAIRRAYSSETITAYTFLLAFVGTIPFTHYERFATCMNTNPEILLTGAGLAVLNTIAAYLLYTKGLSGMENSKASIIASIEPVVASLVGLVVYHEQMSTLGIVGMVMVLLSCILCA